MFEGSSPRKNREVTSGPIARSLVSLAWPVMLANLFQTIYNFVDTLWLGRLGKVAVAAPTLAWPLVFLVISIGFGVTIAGTALVAQYTGARREEEANHSAGQVVAFTGLLAVVLAVAGAFLARPVIGVMGAGPDLIDAAAGYLQIIYAGIPTMFGLFVITALLNGVGDTITPMKLMGVSVALNIALDPLLIFGYGPFPEWGVAGAAVATVVSRGCIALFGLYLLFSGRLGIHIRFQHLLLHWETIKQVVIIGFPSSLGQSGTALGFSIMTGILARFGTAVVSAFGIGNRLVSVALMPAMGLGRATATMVGQNLGAEKEHRAATSAWVGLAVSSAILIVAAVAVYFFRAPLMRLFIDDAEVVALGTRMLTITSLAFPFMGIIQVVVGTYEGSGHTVYSMLFSLFRLWALRIPLVYALGFSLRMGPDGVWWAMFISNAATAGISLLISLTGNWKRRVIKERPVPVASISKEPAALQR